MMANRQGRGPGGIKQFDGLAHVSGDVPAWAVEGGQAFSALAKVAGGLSNRLGRLADQARQREGEAAGLAAGASSGAAYLRQQAALEGQSASSWRDAIASIESKGSGGYAAIGRRDPTLGRALGRYQIMEANIGPWSREALGRAVTVDEFMKDPSIQDRIFDHKFGSYVKKFGLEGAAQAWFAGPGGVGKTERTDVLGTDVGSYGRRFVAAIGGGKGGGRNAPPSEPIVPTLPEQKLALRRDGSVYGEAYDRAARNAFAWRMQSGLSTSMQAAFEANQDDPEALAGALAETHAQFAGDMADPELREVFEKTFAERSETYMRTARANAERNMRATERAAVYEGVAAQRLDVERQAVALGANPEGDKIIEREVARAGRSIDDAISSGALSPAEGLKQKEEVATSAALGRARGVFEALSTPQEKQEFASGLLAEWTDGKGPLAKLPFAKVKALSTTLWNEAQHEINEKTAADKMVVSGLKGRLKDDLASIEATGKGIADIDPAEVERVLGAEGLAAWQAGREQASKLWGAVSGMETASAEDIADRLTALEPKAGSEGFRDQEEVYQAAAKKAKAVLKARADDPAAAVEASFPQVRDLAAAADPENPDSMQALVAGRLQAQEAVGIDELGRQPLTNGEALNLARAVTATADPRAQAEGMAQLVDQVHAAYGPYAGQVLTQVLQARGMDKEMAAYGSQLFAKLRAGDDPGRSDARQGGVLTETAAAEKAGEPKGDDAWPLPNYEQQQMLLEHPELAAQYDAKFGPGAAQGLLGGRRDPNAPVERKEDGGTVRLNPDGSEDWTPDAR